MTLLEDLTAYQARRRFPNWKPEPTASVVDNTNTPEAQVILKALDFLPLELQVATWDTEATLIPEFAEVEEILKRNAADEQKHDQALTYLSQHYRKGDESNTQLNRIMWEWLSSNHHPVAAMFALEMGVFFSVLPALIKYGDVYAATVAQWISDDERVHVETGARLMLAFGIKLTKELVKLVYDTNVYIFSPLGQEEADRQGKRAAKRLVTGVDSQMLKESLPTTIAYFEQHNKQSIVY